MTSWSMRLGVSALLLLMAAASAQGMERMWAEGAMRPIEAAYFGQGMGIFTRLAQNADQEWLEVTYEDMRPPAAACRVAQIRWPGGNNANCWNSTTNDIVLGGTRGRTCQEYKGDQQVWEAHANSSLYSASQLQAAFEGVFRAPMVWDVNVLSSSGDGGYKGGGEAAATQLQRMAEEEGVEVAFLELGNEFYRQVYALDFPDVATYAGKLQAVLDAAQQYYPTAAIAVPVSYSQLITSFTDPSAPVYGTSTPAYYGIHAGLALVLLITVALAVYSWSLLEQPIGTVALLLVSVPIAIFSAVLIIVVVHAPSQPASNSWATTVTHRLFGYATYAVIGGLSLACIVTALLCLFKKPRLKKMAPFAASALALVFVAILLLVIFPTLLTGFLLVETAWEWYAAGVLFTALALAVVVSPPVLRSRVNHPLADFIPPSTFVRAMHRKGADAYEPVDGLDTQQGIQQLEKAPEKTAKHYVVLVTLFGAVALALLLAGSFLTTGVFVSHAAPRPWNDQMQAQVESRTGGWQHFTVHDYGLNNGVLTTYGNSSADWPSVVAAYPEAALEVYGEMVRKLYGNDSKIWLTEAGILMDQYASANCTDTSTTSCFMTKAVNSNVLQGLTVIGRILTAINDEYGTYQTINTFKMQQVFGLTSSQDLGGNELFRFPTADDPGPYCTTYTQVWAHVAHVALDLSNSMQAIRLSGREDGMPPTMLPNEVFGKSLPCLQASFFFNSADEDGNSTCSSFSVVAINRCQDTMLTKISLPACFAALVDPTDSFSTYAMQLTAYVYNGPWGPTEWVPCPDVSAPLPWTVPYLPQTSALNITYLNTAPELAFQPLSLTVVTIEV